MIRRFLNDLHWLHDLPRHLRNILFANFGLKMLAALITVVLWLSVSSQPIAETTLSEPLSFQNPPKRLSIVEQDTELVRLKVRGPRDVLARLRSGETHIDTIVDLSPFENQPGKRIITLSKENVSAPQNVEVVEINPTHISITLAALMEKDVPVEPLFEGQPAPGYQLTSVIVEPKMIRIQGARPQVEQINAVHTETILLNDRSGDFEVNAAVGVANPNVDILGQSKVRVKVQIRQPAPPPPPGAQIPQPPGTQVPPAQ